MQLDIKSKNAFSVTLGNEGNIDNIYCRHQRWNGYQGGLTIVDDLDGRIFISANAKTVLLEHSDSNMVFEHKWDGCKFVARETWTVQEDCLSWKVELKLDNACAERSVQIRQLFPYPYPPYKLQVWSANEKFPCSLDKLGGLHLFYGDACYGTVIPAVSVYDESSNTGFTLSKPFNLKSARMAFHFKDYHSDGLEIESSCLYLDDSSPAIAEVLIHAHEGCWRPGLGWLYEKYPEYFNPPNPKVHELDGGFMITNPYTEARYLKTVEDYNIKWAEIHNHFPYYGNYAPDEDEWESVMTHDYPALASPKEKLSRKKINQHIQDLHENNIRGLLYFQCSGDAFIPYAKKEFPDSIARDTSGKIIPVWKECCFTNASENTSFGCHIDAQIDKFIDDYPQIDGVFLDQVCYQALDTAHKDGITAHDNQPAAMFGHSYEKNLNKLSGILHQQGKVIWGNGPFDIEVQKNIDGIMAEGVSEISNTYKYLCLTKPLLVHTYPNTPEQVETMFRHCLLNGASYSIGASSTLPFPDPIDKEVKIIFDKCIPLAEKLFGRKWVFTPAPLKLPERYDGNIFYSSNDRNVILVSLVSKFNSLATPDSSLEKNIEIQVNLPKLKPVSRISQYSCHSKNTIAVEYKQTGNGIQIQVAEHSVMSVIIIKCE